MEKDINNEAINLHQAREEEGENDNAMTDFKIFILKMVCKVNSKRMLEGRKAGSKLGYWTNGTPPYPYEYQEWEGKYNARSLVVNDEKLKTYREILDSAISYKSSVAKIAADLNKREIPSPRGGMWTGGTIRKLLVNETHLGKIVTNKTKRTSNNINSRDVITYKVIPREENVVSEGRHEPVKTADEHERILMFLNSNTKTPKL